MNFTLKQESLGIPFTFNNDYDRHKLNYYIYVIINIVVSAAKLFSGLTRHQGHQLQLKFYLFITKLWIPTWAN